MQKLPRVRSFFFHVVLASFGLVSPAKAMDEARLRAAVASLGDGAEAQRLEAKVADFVKSGDQAGLTQLAEQIELKDGDFLAGLDTLPNLQKIGLSMGPCHHANIAIRLIAMLISDGTQPVIRGGVIMIDGTEIDSTFAETMHRCELIARLPKPARQIGSSCAMTGDCGGDPDLTTPQ
nr:hypothetical protein [Ensifer oleiphilus]